MICEINTAYFSGRVEQSKGIRFHQVLQLKSGSGINEGVGGHFGRREAVAELRNKLLPDFMAQAGIQDLTGSGLRMAVEIAQAGSPVVHLMAGPDVPAQNPQDWLSPSVPWNPHAPAVFFERCVAAAKEGLPKMAFGNQMLYAGANREVFGVVDGDPKAETHFLVLANEVFGNIMDRGFTAEHLNGFFGTAFQLCQQLGIIDQHIRYVANTGTGFQVGPRVHMHVTSAREGLPSMFPVDYGFGVVAGGTIVSPEDSTEHAAAMALIGKRLQIKGFSDEAKAAKKEIDVLLDQKLSGLRILE